MCKYQCQKFGANSGIGITNLDKKKELELINLKLKFTTKTNLELINV